MTQAQKLRERVKRGEKFLDRKMPGWEKKVKITRLHMTDGYNCVIGQLFEDDPDCFDLFSHSPFNVGTRKLGLLVPGLCTKYGFNNGYGLVTLWNNLWKDVIRRKIGK